jgi:phage terminase large subunit-like protein
MSRRAYNGHPRAIIDKWFESSESLDRYDPKKFFFDPASADKGVDFIQLYLHHVEGEWKGHLLELQPWQFGIVRDIFGWKRVADGLRKYRTVYVEVPKKNGKSTLGAGIALKLTFADDEPGAEVYSAASDRTQAAIVFDVAKGMVEGSPTLAKRAQVFRRAIFVPSTGSRYHVLSADVPTKHGFNIHGLVFDELHTQPNRHLWDTLTKGIASRRQPLIFSITTAGYDEHSICYEQHRYAEQVRDGIIEDDSFLPVIFAADEKDDITLEETQRKANPNFGISLKADYLRATVQKAIQVPGELNVVKRLHFNIWTAQREVWMPMDKWDACSRAPRDDLDGQPCFGGLDLASTQDTASLALLFPYRPTEESELEFDVLMRFWIPAENIEQRVRRDKVPYDIWAREGLLTPTEGNVIDYDVIHREIRTLGERFNIREIAFDRWNATQLVTQLQGDGFTMVPFTQGFAGMAQPMKDLMALVLDGRLHHGGHAVLRWQASEVAAKQNSRGDLMPAKAHNRARNDGIVAILMALGRATVTPEGGSAYDEHGILAVG